MASGSFFKKFRVTLLLLVLAFVGLSGWLTKLRSTDWDRERQKRLIGFDKLR